jgi:hypothetical protein
MAQLYKQQVSIITYNWCAFFTSKHMHGLLTLMPHKDC